MNPSPSEQPAQSDRTAVELPDFTEHLLNHTDAPIAARHYLQDAREALAAAFLPGASIRPLLRKTSECVDTVLTHLWLLHMGETADAAKDGAEAVVIDYAPLPLSLSGADNEPVLWEEIGDGSVFGLPFVLLFTVVIFLIAHLIISRMKPGWHLTAVGGSRRSAYNAGIKVKQTIFFSYVACGVLCLSLIHI